VDPSTAAAGTVISSPTAANHSITLAGASTVQAQDGSITLLAGNSITVSSGAATGSDTTAALAELLSEMNEMKFDRFTMHVERGSDLNLKLTSLEFVSPDKHLTGSGQIEHRRDTTMGRYDVLDQCRCVPFVTRGGELPLIGPHGSKHPPKAAGDRDVLGLVRGHACDASPSEGVLISAMTLAMSTLTSLR